MKNIVDIGLDILFTVRGIQFSVSLTKIIMHASRRSLFNNMVFSKMAGKII